MSGMHRVGAPPQQGLSSFESGSKKKFGKNLNRLQKPPAAPPIPNGSGHGGSSRNGLLLLSTKRSTSATSAPSSGLLANKATQSTAAGRPVGSLRSESYTSAHDALLDAVNGTARSETPKEPDAWGVSEKQSANRSGSSETKVPSLAPNGGVTSNVAHPDVRFGPLDQNHNRNGRMTRSQVESTNSGWHEDEAFEAHENRRFHDRGAADLRRRQDGADDSTDQAAYMNRLARERAEKRRNEEEGRFKEQKERAARRLKELEEKMATGKPTHTSIAKRSPNLLDNDGSSGGGSKPLILEKLGPTKNGAENNGFGGPSAAGSSGHGRGERTLFDPNRTYSSLVGGQAKKNSDKAVESGVDENAAKTKPTGTRSDTPADHTPDRTSQSVIQLTSYEDRDRGERNSSNGPRMLYDPKSGSMVAVTPRDEASKGKRGKHKGRQDPSSPRRAPKAENGEGSNGRSGKKGKGRKDDTPQKRDRRRGDSIDVATPVREDAKKKNRGGKSKQADGRLPRTRGVLYVRDDKGNCYCADGCDGDDGFGSHSVRGGRVRNPVEHAKLFEQQGVAGGDRFDGTYKNVGYDADSLEKNPEEPQPMIDLVKPNEKIELLTGAPDSPTLQATAAPWAPSEAALAAAAAAKDSGEGDLAEVQNQGDEDASENNAESENNGDEEETVSTSFEP